MEIKHLDEQPAKRPSSTTLHMVILTEAEMSLVKAAGHIHTGFCGDIYTG